LRKTSYRRHLSLSPTSDDTIIEPDVADDVPETAVPLGVDIRTEATFAVDLAALRKHVAIFAGTGSGKTVLIRRLLEECALRGVSSIVLDPNNDLSRLGTPWPERRMGGGEPTTARPRTTSTTRGGDLDTPTQIGTSVWPSNHCPTFPASSMTKTNFTEAVESLQPHSSRAH